MYFKILKTHGRRPRSPVRHWRRREAQSKIRGRRPPVLKIENKRPKAANVLQNIKNARPKAAITHRHLRRREAAIEN